MDRPIRIKTEQRVTTMTITRPEKRNAITQAMYADMADALEDYAQSDAARAFIITGAEDYFTSGNDVKDFVMGGKADDAPPVLRFLNAISSCPKPLIAAVNGPAIGVGVTLLLHCDLVMVADTATFSTPFVQLGLVPEAGSSMLLPAAVGMAVANDMLMAGRVLDAHEAVAFGLASRICAAQDLMAQSGLVAAQMAQSAPDAMRKTKSLIRHGQAQIAAQMQAESDLFAEQLHSAEFAEVMTAKVQKRAAVFK